MKLGIGDDFLSSSTGISIANLISDLLTDEELEPFVDNPMQMTVGTVLGPVTVNVVATSVICPQVVVTLTHDGTNIAFHAVLTDTLIDYTATATGINSSGTALYENIDITGDLSINTTEVKILNSVVTHSDAIITDSGGLPSGGVELLADLLDEKISEAIFTATENATEAVFLHLLESLKPKMGINFEKPINLISEMNELNVVTEIMTISYNTQIIADTSIIAKSSDGILKREPSPFTTGNNITIAFGSAMINQYAFAIWDAGNMSDIKFTKSELEGMGMEKLDFPYSNLETANISLLLPPLLEWHEDGPYLHIGGIQIDLSISSASDSTAWTAPEIPVKLVNQGDGSLLFTVDEERSITIMDTGFNRMSSLVDQSKVVKLLNTAVPGVVNYIFSTIPALTIEDIHFSRLNGDPGQTLSPTIDSLSVKDYYWKLDFSF